MSVDVFQKILALCREAKGIDLSIKLQQIGFDTWLTLQVVYSDNTSIEKAKRLASVIHGDQD